MLLLWPALSTFRCCWRFSRGFSSPVPSALLRGLIFCFLSRINTFGPLLGYKHFAPLLPKRLPEQKPGQQDPGAGVAPRGLGMLASLSARVGSTGDNHKGG